MIERIGAAMQRIGAVIGNEVKSLAILGEPTASSDEAAIAAPAPI